MKNKDFIHSLNNAFNGFKFSVKNERNMRLHIFATLFVITFCLFTDITKQEFFILCLSIALVFICELFNTAIEVIVNAVIKIYHPKAKIVKDVAAASVLVAAVNALVIGYIIFIDRISTGLESLIDRIKTYPPNIILITLIITVVLVLIIKTISKKGTPFQGGMPSGHSSISFSIVAAIALWTNNITVTLLSCVLAFLVAQSRVEAKIHSVLEVILGGLLGFLLTLLLFNLLNY